MVLFYWQWDEFFIVVWYVIEVVFLLVDFGLFDVFVLSGDEVLLQMMFIIEWCIVEQYYLVCFVCVQWWGIVVGLYGYQIGWYCQFVLLYFVVDYVYVVFVVFGGLVQCGICFQCCFDEEYWCEYFDW